MPWVMLRGDASAPFRKYVRDKLGNIIETLTFAPGMPQEVAYDHMPLIEGDLFHALVPMKTAANGKFEPIEREVFYAHFDTAPPVEVTTTEGIEPVTPEAVVVELETIAAVEPVNNTPPDEANQGKRRGK